MIDPEECFACGNYPCTCIELRWGPLDGAMQPIPPGEKSCIVTHWGEEHLYAEADPADQAFYHVGYVNEPGDEGL